MDTLIHCTTCGEDMNHADWEANASCCTACGEDVAHPSWERKQYELRPLARVRRRIQLSPFLRSLPKTEEIYA